MARRTTVAELVASRNGVASVHRGPTQRQRVLAGAARRAVRWATWYTRVAIAISCGLNGYEASRAQDTAAGQVAGALLGASVPLLVWLLAQVTAWTYRAGWRQWALVPGAVAGALLALSVAHCATAFAELTGTGALLSVCMAVGIDCGLCASEATAILVTAEE